VSKFVVVVGTPTPPATFVEDRGGTILEGTTLAPDGSHVYVIHFADDEVAYDVSLLVGGTLFGSEWAAREHARHKASGDERA
jgi:hypothetical protein